MIKAYPTHECDFCSGTVRPTIAASEPLRVRDGLVLVDGVEIGKCDRCGHTYFPMSVIKEAERIAQQPSLASKFVQLPIIAA